jgi:hypothetical protein
LAHRRAANLGDRQGGAFNECLTRVHAILNYHEGAASLEFESRGTSPRLLGVAALPDTDKRGPELVDGVKSPTIVRLLVTGPSQFNERPGEAGPAAWSANPALA